MIDENTIKKLVVIIIISLLVILSVVLLWPILFSIIFGLLLAYMFHPVYKLILKFVKEKNISALLIVIFFLFAIFIPLWFLLPVLARQIIDAYTYSQKIDILSPLQSILPETLSKDTFAILNNFVSNSTNAIFSKFSNLLFDLPNILLKMVVILFVFFFALRDSDKLKEYVKKLSPFSREFEEKMEKQFKDMTNSVVYGHILIGLMQGILTGAGLFIFRVPNALILTFLAMFLSILPMLGAWLIWLPVSLYLMFTGHTGAGIGLFLYGAILVSWIDNFLRPYIVARKTKINSGIILVGMIGGLLVFGILGLLIGPLIISYLLVLLDAYKNKELSKFFG